MSMRTRGTGSKAPEPTVARPEMPARYDSRMEHHLDPWLLLAFAAALVGDALRWRRAPF